MAINELTFRTTGIFHEPSIIEGPSASGGAERAYPRMERFAVSRAYLKGFAPDAKHLFSHRLNQGLGWLRFPCSTCTPHRRGSFDLEQFRHRR